MKIALAIAGAIALTLGLIWQNPWLTALCGVLYTISVLL